MVWKKIRQTIRKIFTPVPPTPRQWFLMRKEDAEKVVPKLSTLKIGDEATIETSKKTYRVVLGKVHKDNDDILYIFHEKV